jgi:putative protease
MIRVTYANSHQDLHRASSAGFREILLGHPQLSRFGGVQTELLLELVAAAQSMDLRPILDWDVLMTQTDFHAATTLLEQLPLDKFSAVRVQDPGAFEWLLQHQKKPLIQLNLETGNPNLTGIQRWCDYGRTRLDRILLSSQISKSTLKKIVKAVTVPIELLGLGPILLLYTPRHLLSNQIRHLGEPSLLSGQTSPLAAVASSEESSHRGFRVRETPRGTLFFHAKDYSLLDQLQELLELGIAAFRVDFRLQDGSALLEKVAEILDAGEAQFRSNSTGADFRYLTTENDEQLRPLWLALANHFHDSYPTRVTRCFFQANHTDVLFKKLKNTRVQREDRDYVGEITEISKNQHLILSILGKAVTLTPGQKLKMITPTGQETFYEVTRLQNLDKMDVPHLKTGDFAVLHYAKLIPPKTAVYLAEESIH